MNINFYLERNKKVSNQKTIWCYIRQKKDTLFLNTKEKINPNYWNKETQRADLKLTKDKSLQGSLNSLNSFLNSYENKITEIARNIKTKEPNSSFEAILDGIKNHFKENGNSFFEIFDQFILSRSVKTTKGTIQKYKQTKKHLQDFEQETGFKLSLNKINSLFIDKFYPYLINEKNFLDNTANKTISFIKAFMNWAIERKLTDNTDFRSFKLSYKKNDVLYLTETDLMKLYNLKLDNERLERVRDVFVFQCFTGQRYSDVQNIDKANIKNGIWRIRTQKTSEMLEIPLNNYALSILAKYSKWDKPLPTITNQKMNKYLKELCEIAEINEVVKIVKYQGNERFEETSKKFELIGTHTARRTFITLSLKKGMKPDYIMKIVGHSDYRMMTRYLKIENEDIRKEMDNTWGSSLRIVK